MKKLFLFVIICFVFVACKAKKEKENNKIETTIATTTSSDIATTTEALSTQEGSFENNVYSNNSIGWKIKVPEGWKISTNNNLVEKSNQGEKAIEAAYGADIDLSKTRYLVSFSKDQFNSFVSTLETLDLKKVDWNDNRQLINDMIYNTYRSQNILADTSSSKVNIDGLSFDVFHITIRGADKSIVLQQELYSAPIGNNYFGININYNNENNKKELLNAWLNSKFKK